MAESRENSAELLQPDAHLWNQMLSYIKSESLRCAIQLGIPDAVHQHGKPMKLSELIAALSIHPAKASHMYRLLRVLVNSGFCVQEKADDDEHEQVYTLTSAGRRTLGDAFPSSRNAVLLMLDHIHRKAFQFLSEWVMNDDPSAFHTAFGMSHWDYTAQDPRFNDLFNQAMGKISEVVRKVLIIIELLTEAENQEAADWSEAYNLFDMQMMAVHGGKERSKKDWESVFFTAGFTDYKIVPGNRWTLIEVYYSRISVSTRLRGTDAIRYPGYKTLQINVKREGAACQCVPLVSSLVLH